MEIISTMNNEPIDLSIIIPMYNIEDYIIETLDSMKGVANFNIELLLIDDGSTDNTLKKAEEWVASNNKVSCRVFSKKNEGLSATRNMGIKEANGEFITFFDSDDIAISSLYHEILHIMNTYDVDFSVSRGVSFDHKTQETYEFPDYYVWEKIMGNSDFKILTAHQEPRIARLEPSAVVRVFRRDFLVGNSLTFPEGLYFEDALFHAKCILKSKKIAFINKTLLMYRVNRSGQITNSFGKKREDILHVLDQVINEYNKKEVADNVWANLTGLLLRMTVWCSENCAYEDKKNFVDRSITLFNRLPKEIIATYMNEYCYSELEYNVCLAYLNNDKEVLYVAAEGGFPHITKENNFNSNVQINLNVINDKLEQLISQQRDGWAHDRFNVINSKIDALLRNKVILSRIKGKIKTAVNWGK
ncbi:glycosyltransferase family 2 protein [Serratia proteamaculans]|uniref:glycosyltransferase family 2 protein n=1 Tax=Serratia proteamaculans TaxID=28151 RepID=UPI002178DEF7|nr:glycosyltransferase family A protein [Serratia proteamaculans]CAI1784102.1 Chondroitin polymerase [Serratia proteamaculans]